MFPGKFAPVLITIATAALVTSCSSPRTKIAAQVDALKTEWATNLAVQTRLAPRTLDWPAALAELRAHNLKLRQTRTDLTNAQEAVRQVFRDLVPTLNLHAGLSKRIVDLDAVSFSDVTFSADSLFNIPGVVSFNARLYMARLSAVRAAAAYALSEREQIVELYKLFWGYIDVEHQAHRLETERQTARAFESIDPFTGQVMLTQSDLRERVTDQESENLQQRASELLGSHQYRWAFSTNGLPSLPYDENPLPLEDTNRVAQLQLRLAAIELEAARAELAGIKLRYWPELNIFVSGPPLYQRSFGNEKFWDAREVRMSADVFWWIDTRGYISRQLRQTKRQRDLQRERLRQDSLALMERLVFARDLLKTAVEKERDLVSQLQIMEAVPPVQTYAALQKYTLEYEAAADQLRQIRRDAAELRALFWFVDEAAWTQISPMPPLASSK